MTIDERFDRVERFKQRVLRAIDQGMDEDDLLQEEVIGSLARILVTQCVDADADDDDDELEEFDG